MSFFFKKQFRIWSYLNCQNRLNKKHSKRAVITLFFCGLTELLQKESSTPTAYIFNNILTE